MFDLSTLILFTSACSWALAPGPDNLFVLTQSALKGRLVGLVVTLGPCTCPIVHTSAGALGLPRCFRPRPQAFNPAGTCGRRPICSTWA